MNKILSGVLGVVVVAGMVGGSAFALLTDNASLTNIALSTGTADLQIKLTNDPIFGDNRNVNNEFFDALIPGVPEVLSFDLRNDGSDVSFLLTGMVGNEPTGDWETLKGDVLCAVHTPAGDPDSDDPEVSSGMFTLQEWQEDEDGKDLPGDPLAPNTNVTLNLTCVLDEDATQGGLSVTDLEFRIVGTQVDPTPEEETE